MAEMELKSVRKAYGNTEVLRDIDLKIEDGEFVVLVGPSGCGKSTLLRMIAGLEPISGGAFTIGGQPMNDVAPRDRDIAMVFQSYALYPHMSVERNMGFSMEIRREPVAKRKGPVAEAAQTLGLDKLLDRFPKALSGGQRQRVAMGRAIVRDPKAFLFDEPLSNLDAALRVEMRLEIAKLHQRLGATMVYVTHDQVEAMTLADRIVVMHDGRIEQIGSPMELFLNPANTFVAGFLGSPPMNMVKATIVAGERGPVAEFDGQSIQLQQIPTLTNAVGQEVILGVRPEFVSVANQDDANLIKLDVDLVETLGSEALIHASLQGEPFVIRTDTVGQMHILDGIRGFTIKPHLVKVFDAKTGAALPGQVLEQ